MLLFCCLLGTHGVVKGGQVFENDLLPVFFELQILIERFGILQPDASRQGQTIHSFLPRLESLGRDDEGFNELSLAENLCEVRPAAFLPSDILVDFGELSEEVFVAHLHVCEQPLERRISSHTVGVKLHFLDFIHLLGGLLADLVAKPCIEQVESLLDGTVEEGVESSD